jgi:hypothetical protein
MKGSQVIELVLIEGGQNGEQLYVLEWEYDRANDKVIYLKLFSFKSWMKGRRDHPEYIAPKGDAILYERDESGYFSTSNRQMSLGQNGKWYDEYGRSYTKSENNLSLTELKLQLFHLDILEKLDESEIISRMKNGGVLNLNRFNQDKPSATTQ